MSCNRKLFAGSVQRVLDSVETAHHSVKMPNSKKHSKQEPGKSDPTAKEHITRRVSIRRRNNNNNQVSDALWVASSGSLLAGVLRFDVSAVSLCRAGLVCRSWLTAAHIDSLWQAVADKTSATIRVLKMLPTNGTKTWRSLTAAWPHSRAARLEALETAQRQEAELRARRRKEGLKWALQWR
jgi:hypothetical protein